MKPARLQAVTVLFSLFVLAASSFLAGCGSTGKSASGSSSVTLTIGGSRAGATAAGRLSPRAIPVSIATVTVTVSGPGMDNIVKTIDVAGRSTVVETLSVPKGLQRTFTIVASDASGVVRYQGTQTVDVLGDALSLSIPLTVAGTNPAVNRWFWRNPVPTGGNLNAAAFGNGTFVVVGDDGLVMTSTDNGATWTQRITGSSDSLTSVAVSGSTIVAVGYYGTVVRSGDGGATWSQSWPTELDLYSVTAGNGTFVAVGDAGEIIASTDGGATWTFATSGTSAVLHGVAYGNGTFVACGNSTFLRSTAGTAGWTDATPAEFSDSMVAIAFGNGQFVAIDSFGTGEVSDDNGATWSYTQPAAESTLYSIAYGDDRFVTVGYSGNNAYVNTTDGGWTSEYMGWTTGDGLGSDTLTGVAFGNHTYVAVGYSGIVVRTADPSLWNPVGSGRVNAEFYDVASGDGTLVAVGSQTPYGNTPNPAIAAHSTDGGRTWSFDNTNAFVTLRAVAHGGGTFVAVGEAGTIIASANGSTWTAHSQNFTENPFNAVAYGGGAFVAAGSYGAVGRWDGTGTAWTDVPPTDGTEYFNGVAYGNSVFVLVGGSGSIYRSTDGGLTWDSRDNGGGYHTGVAFGDNAFVVIDSDGTTQVSTDGGLSWNAGGTIPVYGESGAYGIKYGGGIFMTTVDREIFASADRGATWTSGYMPISPYGIGFGNGTILAVGNGASILQSDPL
jgi:photosystem II stability/assembly factor-like uncharacterized protein